MVEEAKNGVVPRRLFELFEYVGVFPSFVVVGEQRDELIFNAFNDQSL